MANKTTKNIGTLLSNILSGAIDPLTKYSRFLNEATAQTGRYALDKTSRVNIDDAQAESDKYLTQSKILTYKAKQTSDQTEKAKLLNQAKVLAQSADAAMSGVRSLGQSQQTFYEDPKDISNKKDIALTGTKATAGAAAYAIPGGQATTAGKIGAGMLSGLLSGYGASENGEELTSSLGGAIVGGVTTVALEGLGALGKYVKNNKITAKSGKKAATITGSKLKNDPFFSTNLNKLQETSNALGVDDTMDSLTKMDKINNAFNAGQDSVDDILKNSTPVEQTRIQEIFNKNFAQLDIDNTKPSVKSTWGIALDDLNDALGDNVKLNKLKTTARKEMGNAFTKDGANLTDKQKIWSSIYDTTKEALDDVSPDIRTINNFQKDLFSLADEFSSAAKKSSSKASISIPGTSGANIEIPLRSESIKTGTNKLGNTISNIASLPKKAVSAAAPIVGDIASTINNTQAIRNPLLQQIINAGSQNGADTTASAGADTTASVGADTGAQQNITGSIIAKDKNDLLLQLQQNGISNDVAQEFVTKLEAKENTSTSNTTGTITPEMAAMAQIMLPAKEAAKIKAAYEIQKSASEDTTKSKSSTVLQMEGKATTGLQAANLIETMLTENPNLSTRANIPMMGLLKSQDRKLYESAIASLTDAIGGLRTGASVSKEQQIFYKNMLPTSGDDAATVKTKLNAIRTELQGYVDTDASGYSSNDDINTLMQMLGV